MRAPAAALILLAGLWPSFACGGDSAGTSAIDLDEVPTATLPATLPEPLIVGGSAVVPGGGSTYTIQPGDTLAGIAERFSVGLEDLLAVNPGVDPTQLHSGDVIKLPLGIEDARPATPTPTGAEPTVSVPPATETEAPPTETPVPVPTNTPSPLGQTYVVQAGDIPVTIAEQFGITVEALLAANPGVDPRGLQIGQVLVIPPAPAPAT